MADKILRVIFSGISTLYPGPPRKRGEKPPDQAFVLMAANYLPSKNDWGARIAPHFPFVYVPEAFLGGAIPEPDDRVVDGTLGNCNIYFLENARMIFDPLPRPKLQYYIDPKHDLGERPGSDDIANEEDIRWLASFREVLKKPVGLKSSDLNAPGPEMAAVVELEGGVLKARFPCKSVQAQTFKAAGGKTLPGIKRVLADEFSIDMSYPERTTQVKLRLRPLRMDKFMSGISTNELTLRWPKGENTLEVRMGNDTKREARLMTSFRRCNARVGSRKGEPIVVPRDDDFFLHYELLHLSSNAERPLPQAGFHQTDGNRCKPGG